MDQQWSPQQTVLIHYHDDEETSTATKEHQELSSSTTSECILNICASFGDVLQHQTKRLRHQGGNESNITMWVLYESPEDAAAASGNMNGMVLDRSGGTVLRVALLQVERQQQRDRQRRKGLQDHRLQTAQQSKLKNPV